MFLVKLTNLGNSGKPNPIAICQEGSFKMINFCFLFFEKLVQNALCPGSLKKLFDECCAKLETKRPTMSNVVKTLRVSRLIYLMTMTAKKQWPECQCSFFWMSLDHQAKIADTCVQIGKLVPGRCTDNGSFSIDYDNSFFGMSLHHWARLHRQEEGTSL